MTDSALPRDPLMPRRPKGMGAGLGLAILAHLLLILAIAFGVNWRAHEPAGIEAELWSAVPQAAAPRAAAPEPAPQPAPQVKPPPPPPPPPKAEEPPPKPAPDPQIAIEKAKREEQQKLDAKRLEEEQEQAKREKAKREEQKREEAKREEAKREEAKREQAAKEEQDRKKQAAADAAKAAAAREAYLKRMQGGLAGATGSETSTGTAMQSSGPSASYAGRIIARILPNIIMTDAIDGDPKATVEVKVAPDGKIIGRRLLRSSGVSSWDDAVLRAIDRTDMLPRDVDGRVPPVMELTFNPKQVR